MLHTHIVLQKRIHVSALISSSFLLVLSILAFFPVASSYSSTLAAPAPSETILSMTAENINLDLSVGANGAFNVSDPADLSVVTNNFSGYTLSILANSTDETATKLLNGEYAFNSISTTSSADDFNVGNWGIRPSKVNSTDNTDFIPAPTTEGTVLDATSVANANANTYTIALGAKADYSLPAGRYSNSFVVTAVANPVGYAINYDANTEDTVTDMPDDVSGELSENDVYVSDLVPVRTGYVFNNWCDGNVTSSNGTDSCDGTVYEPGDVFDTSMLTQNELDLVALWDVVNYNISYNLDGGSVATPNPIAYNVETNTFTLTNPTKTGYTFKGWSGTGLTGDTNTSVSIAKGSTDARSYTANWTANTYYIAYTTSSGSGTMSNTTCTYDANCTLATNSFTRGGYTFDHWSNGGSSYSNGASVLNLTSTKGGTVTLSAQWTANTYYIQYAGNGNTGGSMANTTCTYGRSCTLRTNAYTKSGYVFEAWKSSSGLYYTDGQSVSNLTTTNNATVTLTAQWLFPFSQAFANAGKSKVTVSGTQYYRMQDMTTAICNAVTTPDTYSRTTAIQSIQLVDVRDNHIYNVTKTKDGRCWMQDNLALDLSNTTVQANMNQNNTNATNTSISYLINGGGTQDDKYAIGKVSTSNYWSTAASGRYSAMHIGHIKADAADTVASDSLSTTNGWKNGVFYNFCAASAGSFCYGYYATSGLNSNQFNYQPGTVVNNTSSAIDANEDICPTGWRLPTGGAISTSGTTNGGGEFQALKDAFGSSVNYTRNWLHMPLAGYISISGSQARITADAAAYWTSTIYDNASMYTLRMNASYYYSQASVSRDYGYAIRCIAK